MQLHSVACEAVVNPCALSSIRRKKTHNLKEWENAWSERKFQSTKRKSGKSGVKEAREFACAQFELEQKFENS